MFGPINQMNYLSNPTGPARTAATINRVGVPVTSTTQVKIGTASAYFPSGSAYLTTNNTSIGTAVGSGNFTIEFWLYSPDGPDYVWAWVNASNDIYEIRTRSGGTVDWRNGATNLLTTSSTVTYNAWTNIAIVKNSGTMKIYINGTADATTYADSNNYTGYNNIRIGQGSGGFNTNGYIDELRISNIARYTSNYTPATTAFTNDANTLLLCHMDGANNGTVFTDDNS
jgi:hypothetical protein